MLSACGTSPRGVPCDRFVLDYADPFAVPTLNNLRLAVYKRSLVDEVVICHLAQVAVLADLRATTPVLVGCWRANGSPRASIQAPAATFSASNWSASLA